MNEFELKVVTDFLAAHWAAFESHCEDHGEDAQALYESLGGED